tara:strand:- start:809 stop:1012 length:204 start_codon:yes stop_codon:yes gene_type:complete
VNVSNASDHIGQTNRSPWKNHVSLLYLSLLSLLLLPAILTNAGTDDTLRIVANGQITDEGLKETENV